MTSEVEEPKPAEETPVKATGFVAEKMEFDEGALEDKVQQLEDLKNEGDLIEGEEGEEEEEAEEPPLYLEPEDGAELYRLPFDMMATFSHVKIPPEFESRFQRRGALIAKVWNHYLSHYAGAGLLIILGVSLADDLIGFKMLIDAEKAKEKARKEAEKKAKEPTVKIDEELKAHGQPNRASAPERGEKN